MGAGWVSPLRPGCVSATSAYGRMSPDLQRFTGASTSSRNSTKTCAAFIPTVRRKLKNDVTSKSASRT